MQLLVAVVNDPDKLDEILSGYLELGITGATVLGSEGMGRLLTHDIPIFAGLQSLMAGARPQNRTIFSVVPDDKVEAALALLQDVCGNLDAPATGADLVLTAAVSDPAGNSAQGNDAATLDYGVGSGAPAAPVVLITEDANNDGITNEAELPGQLDYTVTLGAIL